MASWESPNISLCSWPPTLHCVCKKKARVLGGPALLCPANRSTQSALCRSVCTAAPLFCPLPLNPTATPHHCVWQTCNSIPWQFWRLLSSSCKILHTYFHFFILCIHWEMLSTSVSNLVVCSYAHDTWKRTPLSRQLAKCIKLLCSHIFTPARGRLTFYLTSTEKWKNLPWRSQQRRHNSFCTSKPAPTKPSMPLSVTEE